MGNKTISYGSSACCRNCISSQQNQCYYKQTCMGLIDSDGPDLRFGCVNYSDDPSDYFDSDGKLIRE